MSEILDGKILDGRKISNEILHKVADEVIALKASGITPKLCVILVGENPASVSYVNMKHRACERTGIESLVLKFGKDISQDFLLDEISKLNDDKSVSGILVQLPLPKHINESRILESIAIAKDVDGFHFYNVGRLWSDRGIFRDISQDFSLENYGVLDSAKMPLLAPATPLGIMKLLEAYKISPKGKNVAIIGASNIVGKPLCALMLNAGASVSLCHILTKNISEFSKNADIVCVGVGVAGLLKGDMIKDGAIVIDIGINKIDNRIVGDADFDSVAKKASFITPVPGGVGPMTISVLLQNTLTCAKFLNTQNKG